MSRNPCPDCNSRTGLAEYKDSTYCFKCHKLRTKKNRLLDLIDKAYKALGEKKPEILNLPDDLEYTPAEYLWKYYLYEGGLWSKKYNRLCFPYYNKNKEMIGCWMRDLENRVYPYGMKKVKWLYVGDPKSTYNWIYRKNKNKRTRSIVIVEDVISALRVSKYIDVICLGGTSWTTETILPELLKYKKIIVWLDGDKAGHNASWKFAVEFRVFRDIKEIRTKKDPKCYDDKELKGSL